jgi:ribonuclease VapC
MVVDSSAVLAVLLGEEDGPLYAGLIEDALDPVISAVSVLETALVIGARKRKPGLEILERLLQQGSIRVMPFDSDQVLLAQEAWWQYGKGRHPAGLNLGDCCSYALAKATQRPLLYKGGDFRQTDIERVC